MPSYTFATGVPSIVPAVYATSDTGEASDLNTDDTATASTGVLTLTLDAGDYYAKWRWEGDTHTVGGEVANPAGVQSLGEFTSGGSSPVGLGDYARWRHTGSPDATTGSLDWTVDLDASDGDSITIDSSASWVTDVAGWSYPAPRMTVGVYSITVIASVSSATTDTVLRIDMIGDDGNAVPAYDGFEPGVAGREQPALHTTFYAPEGTHIDLSNLSLGTDGTLDMLSVVLQKVG